MNAKRLAVLLVAPVAATVLVLPQAATSHALTAGPAPAAGQPRSPSATPYEQGYQDGYRNGLVYARDCIRGDSRGRTGRSGYSAEYNRGYVAGIIAAYQYGHRTHCGFGPA